MQEEARCLLWLVFGVLAVPLATLIVVGGLFAHRTSLLLRYGVLTDGVVTSVSGMDASSKTRARAYYSFTDPVPPGAIHPVHTGWSWVDRDRDRLLSVGSAVTIVFLPHHPDVSSLDSALMAAANEPFSLMEALASLPILLTVIWGPVLAWHYLLERRLLRWGHAAMATVLEVLAVRRGGRPVAVRARFEFRNDAGVVRHGVARNIGTADRRGAGAGERSYAVGDVVSPCTIRSVHAGLLSFRSGS